MPVEWSLMKDVGPGLIDYVYRTMQIDEEWSARKSRSFTWWPHRLAQRVWAEPAIESRGFNITKVSAETNLLRNVPGGPRTAEWLMTCNYHATMSAFIWNPDDGHVRLHCSAYAHTETLAMIEKLFSCAVALQAADAHIKVDGLAQLLGGEPDVSPHPISGPRPAMDDMINVIELLFAPIGRGPAPFAPRDFESATRMQPQPWREVATITNGLRALLHSVDFPEGTGILEAKGNEVHPQLGNGLLMLLSVPGPKGSFEDTLALAHELNLQEARDWTGHYFFGGWCVGPKPDNELTFAVFFPARVCDPGLIEAMSLHMGGRAAWANDQIRGGQMETKAFLASVKAGKEWSTPPSAVRRALTRALEWDTRQGGTT